MSFGGRIVEARKAKKMSQEALAKELDATKTTIGRYERDEVKPSIDVAVKIAKTLGISLDYLAGLTDILVEKNIKDRIEALQKLPPNEQNYVFVLMDAFLRDTKAQKIYM
jgi:transcriptional regulator with XRE-family HTH domain